MWEHVKQFKADLLVAPNHIAEDAQAIVGIVVWANSGKTVDGLSPQQHEGGHFTRRLL